MSEVEIEPSVNVFGESLVACGSDPITGFFRDGCCNTNDQDFGSHTVCVQMTTEFLEYSRFKGNDLSTPMPEHGFKGLTEGDSWCLCAPRWLEAHEDGMAPKVFLTRTHKKALDVVPMETLRKYAVDLN